MSSILEQLAVPFAPEHITWKPGSTTKDGSKCMAMAYADLRAYQNRLDEVCGLDWSVTYEPWGNDRIICKLFINGTPRSSTGEHDEQDTRNNMAGTVAEAQAFKRAAAMFGLGRYLYELPSVWVEYDAQARKISKAGQDNLDKRYQTYYNNNSLMPQPEAREVVNLPKTEELDILRTWASPADAKEWAVDSGACSNEHEAGNSFKNSVAAYGGKLTKENIADVHLHFLRRQLSKLAERVAA